MTESTRRPAGGRRLIFWIILCATPLMALAIVEGFLRLSGIGAPPPLFRHVSGQGIDGYVTNPDVGQRYFPPAMQANMPKLAFQYFPRAKAPETFRIFSLGGSSTAGYPYHAHASFSGLLAARLEHLVPQRRIESVNCAMTAVNSHTALDFIADILDHEPDLVLVYMGHNEFYGAGGVGSNTAGLSKANPAVRFLLELRLTALLRRALKIGYSRDAPLPVRNVMELMAAEREIPYDSPLREEAVRIFSGNLTKLVTRCRERQVPVLLCEVSSNVRTQEPFGSAHRAGFTEQLEFDALLQKAGAEQGQGNLPAALEAARRAVQLDSTFAQARYLAGQILDGLGDTGAARREYAAAREMDTVPFRAPAEINRVIHRIAADQGVPLVAVDSLLSLGSPGGIAGDEFFLEHLHFNLHGNGWVSRAIAARMYDVGLLAPRDRWRWREELRPVEYARMAGVTELDIEIGDQRVHMLKQRWPYLRDGEMPVPYASDRDEQTVALARAFIHKEIELNEAHIQLGAYYKEQDDLWRALSEYLSAFRMFPLDPAPAIEAGELWLRLEQPGEAGRVLVRALELNPDGERVLLLLAHALLGTGSPERAAATVARALQINPDSAPALALRDTLATIVGPGAR